VFINIDTKKFGRFDLKNSFIINRNNKPLIWYRFPMRVEDDKVSFGDVKRQFISSEPVGNSCKLGVHQVHQVVERSMRVKYIRVVRKENKVKQRR